LSQPQKRNLRLGNAIRPRIIKARFVRWPRYVQIQRKKRILLRRLKVPAAVAQFFNPLDKPTSIHLLIQHLNSLRSSENTPQKPENKKPTDLELLPKSKSRIKRLKREKDPLP
jgi:large subunit ribosomal protein L7Ae